MLTSKFKVARKAFPTLKPFLSLPSLASSICLWSKMLRANSQRMSPLEHTNDSCTTGKRQEAHGRNVIHAA